MAPSFFASTANSILHGLIEQTRSTQPAQNRLHNNWKPVFPLLNLYIDKSSLFSTKYLYWLIAFRSDSCCSGAWQKTILRALKSYVVDLAPAFAHCGKRAVGNLNRQRLDWIFCITDIWNTRKACVSHHSGSLSVWRDYMAWPQTFFWSAQRENIRWFQLQIRTDKTFWL